MYRTLYPASNKDLENKGWSPAIFTTDVISFAISQLWRLFRVHSPPGVFPMCKTKITHGRIHLFSSMLEPFRANGR